MHLTIFLFNLMGLMWYAGGSRFRVWGRGEDGPGQRRKTSYFTGSGNVKEVMSYL